MMLSSPAIEPGGAIPAEYTCNGSDISPPLAWSGLPPGTRSLVLVVEDPDVPFGVFRHWTAYDIPPSLGGFRAGQKAGQWREARNDFGKPGYSGPCPPPGTGTHHYHFRLLALDRASLGPGAPAAAFDVQKLAEPYAIGRAELIGTYRR